jgi:cold-inducible RNA-binding protein
VVSVHFPTDRVTGQPRGFAFVEFANDGEAAEAVRLFNERELDGRRLRVNMADDRPPRAGGPPFSPGGRSGGAPPPARKPFRAKGSRRGIRARKRSL